MLEFHSFYIGQLVGMEEEYANVDGSPAIGDALRVLADAERETIVKALLAHYGDEALLFIALWRSRLPIQSPFAGDVEDEAEWEETDWEIVNVATDGKLAAYGWLTEGAYPILPNW